MGKPYKIEHIMQYTEVYYYDGDGEELGFYKLDDDTLLDTLPAVPMSDEEIKEWFG